MPGTKRLTTKFDDPIARNLIQYGTLDAPERADRGTLARLEADRIRLFAVAVKARLALTFPPAPFWGSNEQAKQTAQTLLLMVATCLRGIEELNDKIFRLRLLAYFDEQKRTAPERVATFASDMLGAGPSTPADWQVFNRWSDDPSRRGERWDARMTSDLAAIAAKSAATPANRHRLPVHRCDWFGANGDYFIGPRTRRVYA